MILDDRSAQNLHTRASLGETLTQEEQTLLEAWYAHQDKQEKALLSANREAELNALREQVQARVNEVQATTQHIQSLAQENEALRHEIETLRIRLSRTVQK